MLLTAFVSSVETRCYYQQMSKVIRLQQLLQEIRLHTPPVTAAILAEAMSVSERTIYRDIQTLRESGAVIEGEAGYGYSLTEDPAMPPQIFSREEIEALVLGLREVQAIADPALARAAEHALAKLHASLPPRLKGHLKHAVLHAKRFKPRAVITVDVGQLREAAWQELAVDISYVDFKGSSSTRRVYPLSIVYMDEALVMLSHCCLRKDTRVFRLDRLQTINITNESFHPYLVPMLAKALKSIKGGS